MKRRIALVLLILGLILGSLSAAAAKDAPALTRDIKII